MTTTTTLHEPATTATQHDPKFQFVISKTTFCFHDRNGSYCQRLLGRTSIAEIILDFFLDFLPNFSQPNLSILNGACQRGCSTVKHPAIGRLTGKLTK
jgi:hypothetical protein